MMLCMIDFLISLFSTLLSLTLFLNFWWKWGSLWSCVCVSNKTRVMVSWALMLEDGVVETFRSRSYCFLPFPLAFSPRTTLPPLKMFLCPKSLHLLIALFRPPLFPLTLFFRFHLLVVYFLPSSSCCLQTIRIGVFGADGR
ncbi:hypothetical protein IWZ01DRAFT_81849 [Phyllosticta capitalensis]